MEHEENRFALVLLAAQRTRQLIKGAPALVTSKNRAAVTSLREIAAKQVFFNRPVQDVIEQFIVDTRNAEIS